MTAIVFLQIIFSFCLLWFAGGLTFGVHPDFSKREGSFNFLEKNYSDLRHLPNAAQRPLPPARKPESRSVGIDTRATVAVVIDVKSGKTLFEKKADVPMPLASLTKLMTALVALDLGLDWQKEVEITESDLRESSSSVHQGETVLVRDLFYASLIASDNTATAALARATGLKPEEFVARMNQKTNEIGMLNAHFSDCTGLDPANTATALDVAALARSAFGRKEIRDALMMPAYDFKILGSSEERRARTTDRLLDGVLNKEPFRIQGGKTGYIEESGFNFVFEVKGDKSQDLVVVVFGSETQETRFEDAKNLALWAFENFDWEK